MEEAPNDYTLTLFETCELLSKSSRTVSRYVRNGFLHPIEVKSRRGTLEYRFRRQEAEYLRENEERIRQASYLIETAGMEPVNAAFANLELEDPSVAVRMPQGAQAEALSSDAAGGSGKDGAGRAGKRTNKRGSRKTGTAVGQDAGIRGVSPELREGQDAGIRGVSPELREGQRQEEAEKREELRKQGGQEREGRKELPAADQIKNEVSAVISPDKEIITLLKETTEILRDQLQVKDEQIKSLNTKIDNLIERDRETNILLKGMQDKMLKLEQPRTENEPPQSREPKQQAAEASEAAGAINEAEIRAGKENVNIKTGAQAREDKKKKNGKEAPENEQKKQEKIKQVKQKKGFFGKLFG